MNCEVTRFVQYLITGDTRTPRGKQEISERHVKETGISGFLFYIPFVQSQVRWKVYRLQVISSKHPVTIK
jgi:hypothetical protein